jgi:hypothetical protein
MSHLVTIQAKIRDPGAISAACARMNLAAPAPGTANLFSGDCTGLLVQFPGWQYPAVIDTQSGDLKYDNFNGEWGNQVHCDQFLQLYAVELAKLEARKKGHTVSEQTLSDGSIRVQIMEVGAA